MADTDAFLAGKTAIVSGAARGIGEAIAGALAAQGATVVLFDIDAAVTAVAERLAETTGRRQIGLVADVSRRPDVERVVATAVTDTGGIDILINNAGAWKRTPVDADWDTALADWDEIMDTNVLGVLMLSRACVPHMQARGAGDIVNVSTYYVLPARSPGTNGPETDLYNASKWALNGFTDAWSSYLEKDHIRVNGLCMGAVDTPMLRGLFADGQLPPALAADVMQAEQMGQLTIDLLRDGRTGENIGAWIGAPVELPPLRPPHRRITGT